MADKAGPGGLADSAGRRQGKLSKEACASTAQQFRPDWDPGEIRREPCGRRRVRTGLCPLLDPPKTRYRGVLNSKYCREGIQLHGASSPSHAPERDHTAAEGRRPSDSPRAGRRGRPLQRLQPGLRGSYVMVMGARRLHSGAVSWRLRENIRWSCPARQKRNATFRATRGGKYISTGRGSWTAKSAFIFRVETVHTDSPQNHPRPPKGHAAVAVRSCLEAAPGQTRK